MPPTCTAGAGLLAGVSGMPPLRAQAAFRIRPRAILHRRCRIARGRIRNAACARNGGIPDTPASNPAPAVQVGGIQQVRAYFAEAAGAAAKFLANPEGPRVGALA